MAFDPRLDAFKTEINLVEYAASCGYELVRAESSRNSAVMKSESGDKVIIARNSNGHWVYFSVRDDQDNGTIIDFVLKRRGANNLGRVKQELGRWMRDGSDLSHRASLPRPSLEPSSRDLQRVIRAMATMRPVAEHSYLAARGLGREISDDPRFRGMVYTDPRGNAVFPHQNAEGLCGYEVKNRGFTGFSPGGEKGIWGSHSRDTDETLIIAESAIDALSFFAVTGREGIYLSTAGAWSPKTPELILATLDGLPRRAEVVLAFDNDAQGHKYVDQAMALLSGRDLWLEVALPPSDGEDWNDRLQKLRGIIPDDHAPKALQQARGRGE